MSRFENHRRRRHARSKNGSVQSRTAFVSQVGETRPYDRTEAEGFPSSDRSKRAENTPGWYHARNHRRLPDVGFNRRQSGSFETDDIASKIEHV